MCWGRSPHGAYGSIVQALVPLFGCHIMEQEVRKSYCYAQSKVSNQHGSIQRRIRSGDQKKKKSIELEVFLIPPPPVTWHLP